MNDVNRYLFAGPEHALEAPPTEGPWSRASRPPGAANATVTIIGKDGQHVAEVTDGGAQDPKVAQANADTILRAQETRAALEELYSWVENNVAWGTPEKLAAQVDRALGGRPITTLEEYQR